MQRIIHPTTNEYTIRACSARPYHVTRKGVPNGQYQRKTHLKNERVCSSICTTVLIIGVLIVEESKRKCLQSAIIKTHNPVIR